jgi:hypothetical protein
MSSISSLPRHVTSLSKAPAIWDIWQRLWPLLGVCLVRILTKTQTNLESFVVFSVPPGKCWNCAFNYTTPIPPLSLTPPLALPARYHRTIRYQFVIIWNIRTVRIAVTDNMLYKSQANNSQGHCTVRSQTTADWVIFREHL